MSLTTNVIVEEVEVGEETTKEGEEVMEEEEVVSVICSCAISIPIR